MIESDLGFESANETNRTFAYSRNRYCSKEEDKTKLQPAPSQW